MGDNGKDHGELVTRRRSNSSLLRFAHQAWPDSPGTIVNALAQIHKSVRLGPGCVIGPHVRIDSGTVIGAYSIIGTPPEHRGFFDDKDQERTCGVHIRENVRIFEFVTIHSGTNEPTEIDDGASVFNHSHIAHDCYLGPLSIVGGQVSLAGHTKIMKGANVSGKSCTHQWCVIGPYAMLSPMSFLKNHLPPGELWIGNPARPAGINKIGLERNGLTIESCIEQFGEDFEQHKKRAKL